MDSSWIVGVTGPHVPLMFLQKYFYLNLLKPLDSLVSPAQIMIWVSQGLVAEDWNLLGQDAV